MDPTYTIEEGFSINWGKISNIGLKMTEFERVLPDVGGDCALDNYLPQRFDSEVFKFPLNETVYSKEVKTHKGIFFFINVP